MESFCGSKFWDLNTTWYTETPEFTPCFENTILVWIPCSFLWLYAGLEICKRDVILETIPNSTLNILTRLFNAVLIIIILFNLIYSFAAANPDTIVYPAEQVSAAIKAGTYGLALFLQVYYKHRGITNSRALFIFWFLSTLCGVFEFYSAIWNFRLDEINDQEKCSFSVLMIAYPLVLILFVSNCFSDSVREQHSPIVPGLGDHDEKPWPESKASALSELFFHWIWPVVYLGYKKPLEVSDLWSLNPDDQTHEAVERFSTLWKPQYERCQKLNRRLEEGSNNNEVTEADDEVLIQPVGGSSKKIASVIPPLCKAYWRKFFWGCVLLLLSRFLQFASPQILDLLINHVNSKEEAWKGYFYAVLMFCANSAKAFVYEHHFIIMQTVGTRVRSALSGAVYRKSLLISNAARKDATAGEIVNLMSVDTQRFLDLLMVVNAIWSSPLEIGLALYFLWQLLGPSALAGLAVMILLIPVTAVVANLRKTMQTKQMEAKDERVKLINEVLSGIKVLKLYAWEPSFEEQVKKIRQKEINVLQKQAFIDSFGEFVWYTAPFLVAFVTFGTYVLSDAENILDARKAFVALTLFNIIRMPMNQLPWVISQIVQAQVSWTRLNKFLNAEEIDSSAVTHNSADNGAVISIEDGVFCWGDEDNPTLRNINLQIKEGSLVAVVGVVGSGKSSLLSSILGELEIQSGTVNTLGSIAYAAQQAWIQNDTLKGNILFGQDLNLNRYNKVIKACALEPDLEMLPAGDNTEIGEKGINLSGGQKQRVALARAVYNGASVYLLDDPLSAVDPHVGKHLFDQVIGPKGILRGKTRVLVTHGLTYLPQVDCIFVMKDGEISERGTFQELLRKKGDFADFLTEYLNPEDLESADSDLVSQIVSVEGLKEKVIRRRFQSQSSGSNVSVSEESDAKSLSADVLIEEERTEVGGVKFPVYFYYLKHVGWDIAVLTILFYLLLHGLTLFSNIWLSIWSMEPTQDGKQDIAKRNMFLGVYGGLGIGQSILVFLATSSMILGGLRASKLLHNHMLERILRAPMSFFDTTPLGRIVNRFAKDVDVADETFPWNLRLLITSVFEVFMSFVAIVYGTPMFLTVILPLIVIYVFIQRFYVASSRQLKRLESVSRSPIYSHFSETLTGVSTIRAYGVQARFIAECERTIDANLMAFYPSIIASRWLSICLETLGNFLTFFAALFLVISHPDAGTVGLSLTYALNMLNSFNWLVSWLSSVETNVVAIERIKEYGEVPQEAPWEIPEETPAVDWPENGVIEFKNFETRYREGLELILKGVSCQIKSGEKVGIVGRTGAGKSSVTLGLFRIIEAAEGSIEIDGVDISKLGLHDVRGNLTIIPQDPVLFTGTLRMNLDPFEKYADSEVWSALEFAHLKDVVKDLPAGLEHAISEGGENLRYGTTFFIAGIKRTKTESCDLTLLVRTVDKLRLDDYVFSVGQRQLVCLARAVLRKTKILILDEATAAVDLGTDDLIQQTIRREFQQCTVLTIAHRLNTIMDYNRVMVLDKGEIREFDAPNVLLEDSTSIFYSMAKDAGLI